MVKICPNCGAQNFSIDRYCKSCGIEFNPNIGNSEDDEEIYDEVIYQRQKKILNAVNDFIYDESYINTDGFSEKPNIIKLEREKDVDGLIEALHYPDVYIKRNSIKALSKLNDPRSVPVLKSVLNDNDKLVRKYAQRALDKFKNECPECKFNNQAEALFCQECGYDLRKIEESKTEIENIDDKCPDCGFKNLMNAKFCSGCGNKLEIKASYNNQDLVDINNDSEEIISTIPGIGPVLAKKAIKIRENGEGFDSTDEFCNLLGLKPHVALKIRENIICNPIKEKKKTKFSGRVIDI